MGFTRRRRRRRSRAIAEIIGAVLLVALTLVAGTILWTFRISLPASPPTVGFVIRSGGSVPAWGDPTDCQPQGNWSYPLTAAQQTDWINKWWNECYPPYVTGQFSLMNTSQVIISSHSPSNILLTEIDFEFVCYNSTSTGGTTILVQGSLESMTWFPGSSTSPAADAPNLGYCGNFDAGGYGGGAYGTLYNRLGLFVPINNSQSQYLQNGDTFYLYIHNGGWPTEYGCTVPGLYGTCYTYWDSYPSGANELINFDQNLPHGAQKCNPTGAHPVTTDCWTYFENLTSDFDDYHGAPPWCFTSPGACEIILSYNGTPSNVLAQIPVYELAPPNGFTGSSAAAAAVSSGDPAAE